jgi:hypothetical protein
MVVVKEDEAMTAAQEELIIYLEKHPEIIKKAVTPTDNGAEIDCAVLREVFDRLGYDGEKEVKKIDYSLSQRLHKICENV